MILVTVTGSRPGKVQFINETTADPTLLEAAKNLSRKWGNKPSQARFSQTEATEGFRMQAPRRA